MKMKTWGYNVVLQIAPGRPNNSGMVVAMGESAAHSLTDRGVGVGDLVAYKRPSDNVRVPMGDSAVFLVVGSGAIVARIEE